MKLRSLRFALLLFLMCSPVDLGAYPLDSFDETGIARLDGYFKLLRTPSSRNLLSAGSLLSVQELQLAKPDIVSPRLAQDPALENFLMSLRARYGSAFSMAVLDISEAGQERYASLGGSRSFVPGSVGKVMVTLCLLDALQRLYPNSPESRERLLRDRMITATDYVLGDSHDVPFWDSRNEEVFYRPLEPGDRANLWTYLDWMMSASSNAAASMVMREVILMNLLGPSYSASHPATGEEISRLSAGRRGELVRRSFVDPIRRAGLDPSRLVQTSFFTKAARAHFQSLGSTATVDSLIELLLRVERGTLIDEFSSLEIKKLLYLTQRRTRYADSRELDSSAVYMKSGSFYSCSYEPGYECRKYEGNRRNLLNAAVIVEFPVEERNVHYLVALSTNILRENSEQIHKEVAAALHEYLVSRTARRSF